jgi:hypothetical protein
VTLIAVLLILLVAGLGAYMIRQGSSPPRSPDVDPEQAVKAAVELHRIRRNLDVAWAKSEQRCEGAALRREIADVLKESENGD